MPGKQEGEYGKNLVGSGAISPGCLSPRQLATGGMSLAPAPWLAANSCSLGPKGALPLLMPNSCSLFHLLSLVLSTKKGRVSQCLKEGAGG